MSRRARRILAVIFVTAIAVGAIVAEGVKQKIRFTRGLSSATVSGAVVRGDRDRYYVGAKEGQHMTVKITSPENNAVFQIYLPGEQESLPRAGEGDDATNWSGDLPADAEYIIVVGGTRGNASYKLTVAVK